MSEWKIYKVGEISSLQYGKMPKKERVNLKGNKYKIFSGYRIVGYYDEYMYKEKKLIVVARGVGGTGDVKLSPKYSWITNLSIIFNLNKLLVDKSYLYYYLLVSDLKSLDTGSAQSQITINVLLKYKIQLPELITQRKIANVLSAYDRLIENNNRRIQILEQTAEELYKEWFVRMRFPGYQNTKFEKGIPKGWKVEPLINKEVELIPTGIDEFVGNKRYLATADVEGINLRYGEDIVYSERPSRANMQPRENTIWFAKMQNTIKHLYFKNYSEKLLEQIILSTGFAGLKFVNTSYYYYYLSFIRYGIFEDIKNMYSNGSTQVAINNQNIKRINLLLPCKGIINRFNSIVKYNFEMIEKYKLQNQNLTKQRDLLLPRLMNGTIKVK